MDGLSSNKRYTDPRSGWEIGKTYFNIDRFVKVLEKGNIDLLCEKYNTSPINNHYISTDIDYGIAAEDIILKCVYVYIICKSKYK